MTETTYIRAGWLIDGSGGPVREDVLLAVAKGKITGLSAFDHPGPLPAGPLTDLSHCTLLPALVDCHVHLALSGTTDQVARQRQLTDGYDTIRPLIARNISEAFRHGVLALRDAGDAHGHLLRYLRENEEMSREPVQVKSTGRAWHQAGRYGSMLGRHPGKGESLASAFANDREPADQVKLINSGPNSLKDFGRQTPPQFTLDEVRAVVRLAEKQGRKLMVHANGEEPVRIALEAGCHSIEHGYFMGRANLARMADQGAVWVPTLAAMQACAEQPASVDRGNDPAVALVALRTLEGQFAQIALAGELGVTIALGTDAGSIGVHHGEAAGEELRLLLRAGCSLAEAIRIATWNGARLLGIDDELGLIAPGRPAHFIAAHGPPSGIPRQISSLAAIFLDGRHWPIR
ncbi:MAG: amidohydrolase family protein [Thermodesulfobacteriota bacterium]